jgi:DNA polymerase III epsilon subunit-like protein
MIAVDVETTGILPHVASILSIGAVDMANPDRRFYGECRAWDGAEIADEALAVNGFTREQATDPAKKSEGELMCGTNVAFDRDFVRTACERAGLKTPFNYRTVDTHSVAWFYITSHGSRPPKNLSLNRILEMTGIPREPEPHNALTGAMCAAEVMSRMLSGKSLLPDVFDA